MLAVYRVAVRVSNADFGVWVGAKGISEAISIAIKHLKRMGKDDIDVYAVERIDEYN